MRIMGLIRGPRRIRRVGHIAQKCASHGLGFLVSKLDIQSHLPAWMRIPLGVRAEVQPPDLPVRLAEVLEELGPTFVKLGQMLASRPDILPQDYIRELKRICHMVAPFPADTARSIVEQELGGKVEDLFSSFSAEPRASGSLAQVHDAVLADGTEVVVKIQRPGVEAVIDDDLAIMQFLAQQAENIEEIRPLRLPMIVEDFGRGLRRELNFVNEAAYTHKFHMRLQDEKRLVVPQVFWDLTTQKVLTLLRLNGAPLAALDESQIGEQLRPQLARTILDVFLRQFFEIGLFHADPHPGNILWMGEGRIGLIDMGLVGTLGDSLRSNMALCLIALGNEQMELAAEIVADMGTLPPHAAQDEFCSEVAALFDRLYSVPVEKMDFQRGFHEVMDIIRRYGVLMPRDFVLLGKALAAISGLVLELDPHLNAAALAAPYARTLMRQSVSVRKLQRTLTSTGYHMGNLVRSAPSEIRQIIRKLRAGLLEFAIKHEGFDEAVGELGRAGNRLSLSIVVAAIIMASAGILTAEIGPKIRLLGWGASALGLAGLLLACVLGVVLVIGILRSGRL